MCTHICRYGRDDPAATAAANTTTTTTATAADPTAAAGGTRDEGRSWGTAGWTDECEWHNVLHVL